MNGKNLVAPLALACLTLASGAAHAQNSVTLYGVLDDGLEYRNNMVGGGSTFQEVAGNLSGSRWGIKVREDLGSGLAAIAQLESGFNLTDGTTSLSTTSLGTPSTTTTREFSRQAWVGLNYKDQSVTMGRHQAPLFDYSVKYDPGNIATNYSILSQDVAFVTRDDDSVKYRGSFGPLVVEGLYSTRYDTGYGTEVAGQELVGREYSASVDYTMGPVSAGVVIDQRNSNTIATATDSQKRLTAALRYNGGALNVFAGYRYLKASSGFLPAIVYPHNPGSSAAYSSLFWFGSTYRFTPELILTGAAYYQNFYGTGADPWLFVANADYFLSKRTDLYWGVAYSLNKSGSNLGVSGFGTVAPGHDQFGTVIGMRHTF